jgi:hypothetical protein
MFTNIHVNNEEASVQPSSGNDWNQAIQHVLLQAHLLDHFVLSFRHFALLIQPFDCREMAYITSEVNRQLEGL